MKKRKRLRFMFWLRNDIFKIEEGTVSPKYLQVIYNILFPLQWLYERNSRVRYDVMRDIYIIEGKLIKGEEIRKFPEKEKIEKL